MHKRCKVSVVLPVHNGARYVQQSVDSILAQSEPNFELIIIDDGSTDDTLHILQGYTDPRIVVISRPRAGISAALNLGIRLARSEYIARMDADDIALPERLERQLAYLDAHPNVGVVGSSVYLINDQGETIGELFLPTDSHYIYKKLIVRNLLIHPTVMMRKELVVQAGLYDERDRYVGDYALWFRMLSKCSLANLAEPLLKYRISSSSTTAKRQRIMVQQGIKARWMAIRTGLYPWTATIYLVLPLLTLLLPPGLSYALRRKVLALKGYRLS